MVVGTLAEAGFSECARDPGCSAQLNRDMWIFILQSGAVLALMFWLPVLLYFTYRVLVSRTTCGNRPVWLAVVWAVPVVGVIGWMFARRADTEHEEEADAAVR
ncbi:hypothetical protein HH308_28190 [Gordonia sp. TBRC 11910]|uniref:Phospholipase D-like protein n=1 Tax=Gordonia asplenii TaxID=2725283 RepID=A0A848L2W6_9ACTN|nr:hypothetical protein [Gordonia asplenii]NMO05106.1 hypothetical protein [Gordonia asplenii]